MSRRVSHLPVVHFLPSVLCLVVLTWACRCVPRPVPPPPITLCPCGAVGVSPCGGGEGGQCPQSPVGTGWASVPGLAELPSCILPSAFDFRKKEQRLLSSRAQPAEECLGGRPRNPEAHPPLEHGSCHSSHVGCRAAGPGWAPVGRSQERTRRWGSAGLRAEAPPCPGVWAGCGLLS